MASKKKTKMSNSEAQFDLIEKIAVILTIVNTDESSTDDEYAEVHESMLDVSALIGASLKLKVTNVEEDGTLTLTVRTTSSDELVKRVFSQQVGD